MSDVIKISLIFVIILILLRRRMNIGYVMLISAALLFLLYRMDIRSIAFTIKNTAVNRVTLTLLLALSLIRMFELILREQNVLANMMTSVKHFFRSRKAVIISMPLLIGMLPSLGGAYFSAPMVKEATIGIRMSQEEKAFVNYWFRHPWEYVLPLYPGILLASAVTGIPLYNLILANMAYALAVVATGFLYSMRGVGKQTVPSKTATDTKTENKRKARIKGASFLPIIAILLLVVALRVELHYALLYITIPLFLFYRYPVKEVLRVTRHGFTRNVFILIFGVMLFKETMEASGAVTNLSHFFVVQGIPTPPIICLLPFIVGMLTGVTVGYVGGAFPLLLSLTGGSSLADISLAFAIGFIGVLLSPVHLCLILTKEYFKADLWGVYKKMIPASIIIFIVAIIEYLIIR